MIASACLLAVYLILWAYGGLAAFQSGNGSFNYDEVQKRFFRVGTNFQWLMQGLSKRSDQALGGNSAVKFIKINLIMVFSFIIALAWYSYTMTGVEFLFKFIQRGLTINLGDNERNYLSQTWPWYYLDFSRNSGTELYIGHEFVHTIALVVVLFLILSIASSSSIQNALTLVRRLSVEPVGPLNGLLQMFLSFCIGAVIDILFVLIVLITLMIGGKLINVSLEEYFDANASQHWLEYGYTIVVGNHQVGVSEFGMGVIQLRVDFDRLGHKSVPAPHLVHLIFPSPQFENDAGSLCRRYNLVSRECADRLRSLYLEHSPRPITILKLPIIIASQLFKITTSLACGNNLWSLLISETGAKKALSLALPWFASLAVVLLSGFLVIPVLALILFLDYIIVKLGRYAALSSEKGLLLATRHGPALLGTPPIIAIAVLAAFARHLC